MTYEIYLGNWGTIICNSEQERNYMKAAHNLKDVYQNTLSWHGTWLYSTMEAEYLAAVQAAKVKCETLWKLIPDKENI
jgi:hypothetical protein